CPWARPRGSPGWGWRMSAGSATPSATRGGWRPPSPRARSPGSGPGGPPSTSRGPPRPSRWCSTAPWPGARSSAAPTSRPAAGWPCSAPTRPGPCSPTAPRSASRSPSAGGARDAELFVPVTAAQRLFGITRVDGIAVKAPGTEQIDEEQAIIREVVTRAHPDQEYQVLTQEDILGVVGRILGILTLVLASIAGISLVVGGVGVMNIMLVSVSERTREI